jgi:hypothetical protein
MVYDFDPRTNRENLNSKSYPRRLLEDILTNKIVDSMSFGTASNYFTRSYGPNHRIIYEGVGRLLAELLVDTLDNLEDVEYSQLRAEFVATRLMYLVFPDEDSVPVGDTHEETISFLLQTYEALLQGATKKSVDEVLNDIAEGNAVVVSTIEGYIANIKSAILATTEFNTDGVFPEHRHFAFTDESGLGSTNKPIEYKWGDELHTHDIIDGVIQPWTDSEGNSHSHEVYLGIPENIVRLQNNLRKVFSITKPAHIKTGEIASVIDEDIPILAQGKGDVFSPILGIDPSRTDEEIIEANKIDPSLPYYNQNARYGLVGLSLGGLYQEDMRRAREGVYEPNSYGYVSGKKIRFWRTSVKVADTLVIGTQKLRVISVSDRIVPEDRTYFDPVFDETLGVNYITKNVRPLVRGDNHEGYLVNTFPVEVKNAIVSRIELGGQDPNYFNHSDLFNDGEPLSLSGEIYFCDLMGEEAIYYTPGAQYEYTYGHLIKLSYIEVTVDAQISLSGLQEVKNASSTWQVRDQNLYETVEFVKQDYPEGAASFIGESYIPIPLYIVKDMAKTINGLPLSIFDLEISVNGTPVDYSIRKLKFISLTEQTLYSNTIRNQSDFSRVIVDLGGSGNPLSNSGDTITLTYPKAKSEIRRFRELNSLEMTLNAARPRRKVSESGRGIGQNRVIETTSPISYVLNEPQPVTPYTQEQKIATYSAGSSDLLNTSNQTLNTTYTLNNFSLNQTATQDQVFKPATKTLTTSNPVVSFYELGFRPSYITSVVDSEGSSYAYTLNRDHVLVSGLDSEKTLTVSGLSSNPFSADLDWYKGDKLGEGGAFFKHTTTLDLGDFTESTSERYMQNPLGLASRILDTLPDIETTYTYTNDKITGVSVGDHVVIVEGNHATTDEIRSVYSMIDTQTSGVEGELTFYEDVITGYELDGRDGFTSDYNPHVPQDEWLYPDPSLYILGPINIPTHFFFGYSNLTTSGGDGFYFSLYRIDAQGNRQYQTLSLRADSNGFTALEQYPDPVPNGSPLAYRFRDDSLASPNTIDYDNAPAPNFLAEINASFNHLANETYYLEVFMEEDNAADYLYFLTSGTDADFDLGSSWTTSPHAYRLDQLIVGLPVNDVTYTYEITFTLNPGEVRSFSSLTSENRRTTNLVEDNSQNIGYSANDNYATPPSINLGWKGNFETTGFIFTSVDDRVPQISEDIEYEQRLISIDEMSAITLPTDQVSTSLLLLPSTITQSVAEITDSVSWALNYVAVRKESEFPAIEASLEYNYILNKINLSDIFPNIVESVEVPIFQRIVPSSTVSIISDDVEARIRGIGVRSDVPNVSDSNPDALLASYIFLPRSTDSNVPKITDLVDYTKRFVDVLKSDSVDPISDEIIALISSINVSDTFQVVSDAIEANYSLGSLDESSTFPNIEDDVIVPLYQALAPTSEFPTITDAVATSLALYVEDTMPLFFNDFTEEYISSHNTSDLLTGISDDVDANITITLSDTLSFNADATAFISSTNQLDPSTVSITDDVEANFVIPQDYLYLSFKHPNGTNGFEIHLYEAGGEMDSLVYVNSYTTTGSSPYRSSADSTLSLSGPTSPYLYLVNSNANQNQNEDAHVKVGPLDNDKDYTLYFHSQKNSSQVDVCKMALKRGGSNETMTGYCSGETYYELASNNTNSTNTLQGGFYFYYHNIRLRSAQQDVVFTQDIVPDKLNSVGNPTEVYFYTRLTPNNNSEYYHLYLNKANNTETDANPQNNESALDQRYVPDLLPGAPNNTYYNYNHPNAGDYNFTYGYNTDTNVDNVARLSYTLLRNQRYKLITYTKDHVGPDVELHIRVHPTNDGGSSFNTEYNAQSNITYTNLFQQDNIANVTYRHYFYIRKDGFVVWEQDPDSRP